MKAIVITSIVVIAAGVGIYFVGGGTVLALTILIPLFVMPLLLAASVGGAFIITGKVGEALADILSQGKEAIAS